MMKMGNSWTKLPTNAALVVVTAKVVRIRKRALNAWILSNWMKISNVTVALAISSTLTPPDAAAAGTLSGTISPSKTVSN